MTEERYYFLIKNEDSKLTKKEIKEGWHFCCEFDYSLENKNHKNLKDICNC